MNKIQLYINIGSDRNPSWQEAWLEDDVSITMECVNPIFDTSAGGFFSHELDLDCEMNRHIVGNIDKLHGENVYKRLYGKKFVLSYYGIKLFNGVIWIDKDISIEDGKIGITLRSGNKEWGTLIDNKNLQDLDFIEKEEHRVPCGYTFPDYPTISFLKKDTIVTNYTEAYIGDRGGVIPYFAGDSIQYGTQEELTVTGVTFPPILFVKDGYVNTDKPYDPITKDNKYCNIRTCLQRYAQEGDTWVAKRDYNIHEPDMLNSAPCFYVAYIFDRVMEALNVTVMKECFKSIPDFYRLAFIHTNCAYRYTDYDEKAIRKVVDFTTELPSDEDRNHLVFANDELRVHFTGFITGEHRYSNTNIGLKNDDKKRIHKIKKAYRFRQKNNDKTVDLIIREYIGHPVPDPNSFDLYEAYATEENLPDISFSDFLSALQSAFGIRYIYDAHESTLQVVLIKDVLNETKCQELPMLISSLSKEELHTTGFILKYSSSSDYKNRGITGTLLKTSGNDDTFYNYYDYKDVVLFGKNSKNNNAPASYKEMLQFCSNDNKKLYIDSETGNSYRLKVDKDAKTTSEWYPSWFEVGGYRDVRIGDCHSEDTTEVVSIGFTPVEVSDVNGKAEYMEGFNIFSEKDGNIEYNNQEVFPKYALLVDGETHVNFDKDGNPDGSLFRQDYTYENMGIEPYYNERNEKKFMCSLNVTVSFSCKLNYDYTQGDIFHDGKADFVLGIARGGGIASYKYEHNYDFDGEGNSNWTYVAGSESETTADSVNSCGQVLRSTIKDSLSLKLKAEKPYKGGLVMKDEDGKQYLVTDFLSSTRPKYDSNGYETGETEKAYYDISSQFAKRSIFDNFYTEYAYFILNRKVAKIEGEASIDSLLSIDFSKKYQIKEVVGWIKKYSFTLTNNSSIAVKIELYYL